MRKELKVLGVIAIVIIIAAIIGTNYYRSSVQNTRIVPANNTNKNQNVNTTASAAEQLIRPDSATLGPANAKVTLVEFYDPECETCAEFGPIVKQILKENEGKIRLVSRYMPLHPNSMQAATLIEAAGEQGKYWQMQELLFKRQPEWGQRHGQQTSTTAPDINALFEKYAKELGLDLKKINDAIKGGQYTSKIERDKKDGQSLGVRKTPEFFVNGRKLMRFGEQELKALIDEELKR